MKKKIISIVFALVLFMGFQNAVKATYISFYDEDGGNKIGYMEHVHDTVTITVTDPTKTDYDFAGWSTNDTNITINGSELTLPWGAGDFRNWTPRDVFATWTPTNYNITYTLHGGEATGNPDTYTVEDADITLNNPTRNGFDFAGWTDGAGTDIGTTATITAGSSGDKEFIALWDVITYTITYDLDGGTLAETNPDTYTAEEEIILKNPTKEGYKFKGWTGTDLTEETLEVTIPVGSVGNRTYAAVWEKLPENPKTFDGIVLYISLLVLASSGLIFVKKKNFNN